jgi:hypothetical protein
VFDILPLLSPQSNNDTSRGNELSTTAHVVSFDDQEQQPTGKELPDQLNRYQWKNWIQAYSMARVQKIKQTVS